MDSAIPNNSQPRPLRAIVVMGVSGCGKSSVAEVCARSLGWTLHEGDAYHSPASIAKMRAGIPLDDADRAGWLDRLAELLSAPENGGVVLTCSALRRRYRDRLRAACPSLGFVFLELDYDAALARVQARPGHFFSPTLVADQFATLESPRGEPAVLALDALRPVADLAASAVAWVSASGARPAADLTLPVLGDAE